jgi:hypothetical protein
MVKIPSTTLLTLPDGSRVELRVVPADHDEDDADQELLDEIRGTVSELAEALSDAESEATGTVNHIESVSIDADDIANAVSEAATNAAENTELDGKDDAEGSANDTHEAINTAQGHLEDLQKLLKKKSDK